MPGFSQTMFIFFMQRGGETTGLGFYADNIISEWHKLSLMTFSSVQATLIFKRQFFLEVIGDCCLRK